MVSLFILVFIETQDLGASMPAVLERAAQDALGPRAAVSAQPIPPETPDDSLIGRGQEQGAWAVARIVWTDTRRLSARLEVTLMSSGRRVTRPLVFEQADPPVERWRALGLVLASAVTKDAETHRGGAGSQAPPATAVVDVPGALESSVSWPQRWALDAAAQSGFAIGGAGGGAGGTIGLRWLRFKQVGFRLGMRARVGEMQPAQAAMVTVAGSLGLIVDVPLPRVERLGLAVRADALVLYEMMSHLSSDDPAPVRQSRLLPGASLLAELRWSLSRAVAITLAAGPEVAAGTTRVVVRETEVGQLASLRMLVQAGLLAAF